MLNTSLFFLFKIAGIIIELASLIVGHVRYYKNIFYSTSFVLSGCISNCRSAFVAVGGGDNLKWTRTKNTSKILLPVSQKIR